MTVGYQVTKAAIDQRVGSLVVAGESWFEDVNRTSGWAATALDADLIALGYTQAEVTALKGAMVDLSNLRLTAYGQRAQTPASNFFFNATKLRGIL